MLKHQKYIDQFERTRRDLPHLEDVGATYFVCCSLLRPPPLDLTTPALAQEVVDALRYHDGARYYLYDYTVMPDHLHAILQPFTDEGRSERISSVMYSLKSWIAKRINRKVNRRGQLWQTESYDHIIRNREDYEEKASYIYLNPVKAELVLDPLQWPWWGQGSGCRL
jgi:REP element-mobilizing transposase RayT